MLDRLPKNNGYHVKLASLIGGLILLLALAVTFTITTVRIQAGIAGYLNGESLWSRAQLSSVHFLRTYIEEGDPEQLTRALEVLQIPLADLEARQAMEAEAPDYTAARKALIRGGNHPEDAERMIWLFRHFSEFGPFRSATDAWRASDPYILELQALVTQLANQQDQPVGTETDQLQSRLARINDQLQTMANEFRQTMARANREMTWMLSWVSFTFLIVIGFLAWLLAWLLVRTLRASRRKYQAIFEQTAVAMAQVDERGYILEANLALCSTLGLSKNGLLGRRLIELIHPDDGELFRQQSRQIVDGTESSYTMEQRLMTGQGDTVWARLTVSAIADRARNRGLYAVILEDLSEARRLAVELSHQITHDALTGLFNRRAFERRLAESLNRAQAEETQHCLCLIDLDQFKLINDTSGHFAGDRLLQYVVRVFQKILREGDMLARLGGDEFGMVLENCEPARAETIAERLRKALDERPFEWEGRTYKISCSIGVVPICRSSSDVESLLRAADIACYLAKEQGRNRVYLSGEDDQKIAEHHGQMEWLGRIRQALGENRFFLDAQLIVPSNREGDGVRYEVLVRLWDEAGKLISPGAFLPAAERFGVAHLIDRWVINHAFHQLARHPEHLARLDACHINLSGRSFDQPDFQNFVLEALDRHRIPGKKICFEITETAAVNNLVQALAFMRELGKRGCQFALDDFGTGLSSFSYLRRFPVDYLKIDGIFVQDMATDNTDLAMVRAINDIGLTLGKQTIAEFVENESLTQLLRDMGVDYQQGFGIHKPVRLESFLESEVCV